MVDKKKENEEKDDLTPEEEAAQAGESVEPGEASEERIADEDISGEDVSGEDVSAEDVSGEEVSTDEAAEEEAAEEEAADEAAEEGAADEAAEEEAAEEAAAVATYDTAEDESAAAPISEDRVEQDSAGHITSEHLVEGVAAFFDHPKHLLAAATHAREAEYVDFEAFSPFPIHGMDAAMGLGRSWIPWVTMGAGLTGFICANLLQFGMMTFDWPINIGGKPYAPWPSFVPVMFELSVLFAGVTTVFVMLKAAGCFKKPLIIDPKITDDSFVLWISAQDKQFELGEAIDFLETLNPLEVRKVVKDV